MEIVREIYEGWSSGDFRAGADLLDQNVMFVVSSDFPEFGVFIRPGGVKQFMQRFKIPTAGYAVCNSAEEVKDALMIPGVDASAIVGDFEYRKTEFGPAPYGDVAGDSGPEIF